MNRKPFTRLTSLLLAAALSASCLCFGACAAEEGDPAADTAPAAADTDRCAEVLGAMSTEEKIAQMIMPEFRSWTDGKGGLRGVTAINDDIAGCLKSHGFAGVIFFAQNAEENDAAVRLTDAMQKANASVPGRPQLLTAIDQEGGLVTRLGQGTQMPGNMALGAANDPKVTARAAGIIGEELAALGFNVDFAPVVDVNSNPSNPVIGIRSFSDSPALVSVQGAAFMTALREEGVIPALKHFPGHGDTAADSHTGLPCITKTYEELKESDLVPFAACIDAGAEMVMTAHIQYPNIETGTYTSVSTGEKVYLPATLSRTILTDILRGDLGFQGVVITDSLEMDAIAGHFDRLDAARLAIEAGVDILLMPVSVSSPSGVSALDRYIKDVAAMVERGEIDSGKVDAAVLRILQLKERHGLLEPYDGGDVDARAADAVRTVGSRDHHDAEWEITQQCVTLVKNENDTLPIDAGRGKTVILAASDNELLSLRYAVGLLRDQGKLPGNADISVLSYQKMTRQQIFSRLSGAKHVVVVSEISREGDLDPNTSAGAASAKVDAVIRQAHENGADVAVLSADLPYDAARYPAADAIMIAWSAKGMGEDPRSRESGVAQYGPNLPAALYLMLSPDESPAGKLPVNIPALDSDYRYTSSVLYPRGFGLTYPGRICPMGEPCPLRRFTDTVHTAWYHDGVRYALEQGIMSGYGTGTFGPNDDTSRAMIAQILWNLEGRPAVSGALSFNDVEGDKWYAGAVRRAVSEAIMDGYGDGRFGPEDPMTREQLVTILCRYAQYKGADVGATEEMDPPDYDDFSAVSPWARSAMEWAVGVGAVRGKTDTSLAPGDRVTRAEIATLMMRCCTTIWGEA